MEALTPIIHGNWFFSNIVGLEEDSSPVDPGDETLDVAKTLKQRNQVSHIWTGPQRGHKSGWF